MAEYIWIDAEGGVRSKTKVRVTPIIAGGSLSRNLSQTALPLDKPAHFPSTATRSEPLDESNKSRLNTNQYFSDSFQGCHLRRRAPRVEL
jgi:hypothetical protein